MPTTVNVTLSDQLQTTLSNTTGGTVHAWAVYFTNNGATANYQELLSSTSPEPPTSIALPTPYNGGKLYFIIQSVDTAGTIKPLFTGSQGTSTSFTESDLSWQNAKSGNFRYDSYELSVLGQAGDSGNLTSVDAFAIPMSIDINYPNGAPQQTRGYAIDGQSVFTAIGDAFQNGGGLVQNFTVGPLANTPRMAAAPGQSNADGLPGVASAADWYAYVESVGINLASQVQIAGQFNGAGSQEYLVGQPAAVGSYADWHNAGFYSYSLQYVQSPATVYSGSETLGSNPFTTTVSSNAITVTDPNAGTYKIGTVVSIQNATAFSVFTADQLNGQHTVTNVISPTEYQFVINTSSTAPAVVSGGGSDVVSSVPLAANPFSAQAGDSFFTVTDPNASAFANTGVQVTFSSATAFAGFTADYLNGTTFTITKVIDATHYEVGSTAVQQTGTGGGSNAAPTYVRPNAGNYIFTPDLNSQVQGTIAISSQDLANSIYQTLGSAQVLNSDRASTPYMFTALDSQGIGIATPYMNTGANSEWGGFFVKLLTGYIGGYYGATGAVSNPYVGGPSTIDLSQNWNFDPSYAFDSSATTPYSWNTATYGTGVPYDKYANIFFTNSNSYGNGYSDAVMSLFAQGGPLIPNAYPVLLPNNPFTTTTGASSNVVTVSDPNTSAYGYQVGDLVSFAGAGTVNGVDMSKGFEIAPNFFAFTIQSVDAATNTYTVLAVQNATAAGSGGGNAVVAGYDVSSVNITLYDNNETPPGGQTLAQHQLYTPTAIYNTSSGPFVESGQGAKGDLDMTFGLGLSQMRPRDDLDVSLGFYAGMDGQSAKFNYVKFDTAPGTSLFQQWDYNGTTFTAAGSAAASGTGFTVNDLPYETGWNWYQLVFADTQTGVSRTYNIYLNAVQGGILNPSYVATGINQAGDIAIDGLASFTGGDITDQTITNLTFNMFNGGTLSMDPSLLAQITDMTVIAGNPGVWIPPTVPVLGTLSGGAFTGWGAVPGQGEPNSNLSNVSLGQTGDLAFGWFGADQNFLTQAVLAGQGKVFGSYTNKIGGQNIAQISFLEGTGLASHATMTAFADIDGKWVTGGASFGSGTYHAVLTEFQSYDGQQVNNPSAFLEFTVNIQSLSFANTSGSNYLQLDPGGGGVAGNWIELRATGSSLPNGTLLAYATDSSGNILDRDGNITTDLGAAVLARIGVVRFDDGTVMGRGDQSVYLQVGNQLHFAIQTGNNVIEELPGVQINGAGPLTVTAIGAFGQINVSATIDNVLSPNEALAGNQRDSDQPWYFLTNGSTFHIDVKGSSWDNNVIRFVKFDVDPGTGAWSVGGVPYGNTDAFRAAVRDNWDPNVALGGGRGNYQASTDWTVTQGGGFYTPVLVNESGNIFVIGNANIDGQEHIRTYGGGLIGFEDRVGDSGGYDFNDAVAQITRLQP
jgi:hypothetical protein